MAVEHLNINQYFYEYLLENKLTFFVCIILLFTYPLQRVVLPKYYGKVISNLQDGSNKNFIESGKMLLIIYASVQFLHSIYQKVQGALVPKFSEFSLKKIFSSLLRNNNEDFENMKVGEILSKVTKLPHMIYRYLDILKSVVFSQVIVLGSCLFHYYHVSFQTLVAFIFVVCGVVILQIITYKTTMTLETKREKEQGKIYQHVQDVLNNLVSVIVCKSEDHEKDKLGKIFAPFTEVFNKVLNINFIMRVIFSFFNIFAFSLINYMLYKEYQNKTITKEHFISSFIITYSVLQLFNDAAYSVRMLVDMTSQISDMENFFNKTIFINSNSNTNTSENAKFVNGDIVMKNVSYKYDKHSSSDDNYALKNINTVIRKNENVAIVGHIGSGKSTLIKMLLKLSNPTEGTITIGGVDITHLSKSELYSHVFYIPQKPKLLNRTLYENIIYGLEKKDKSEMIDKIYKIMQHMSLDGHTIKTFKEKMEDNIGIDGSKLSGGQRQIIWTMRALLRNPTIIIMDEPTSSLDNKNKEKIFDIIDRIGTHKTVIIISHDKIGMGYRKINLKGGRIDETLI